MGSFQETVPLAVNWLEEVAQGEQPFFLFVHSYDVHIPYTKPAMFGLSATPGYDGILLDRADDSLLYERIYESTLYPDFPLAEITTHTGDEGHHAARSATSSRPGRSARTRAASR